MTTRLIVRLLTADGTLLGWVPTRALAKGDGGLWATEPVIIAPVASGQCAVLSVHWPDLHVQQRAAFVADVEVGHAVALTWPAAMMQFPSDDGPLPAVTVGAQQVTVPTGALGAVAP